MTLTNSSVVRLCLRIELLVYIERDRLNRERLYMSICKVISERIISTFVEIIHRTIVRLICKSICHPLKLQNEMKIYYLSLQR